MLLPTIDDVNAARDALFGIAIRTPLVRLNRATDCDPGIDPAIWLKLENLQPTGSFKLRGAAAVLAGVGGDKASAGLNSAGLNSAGLNSAGLNSAGLNSAGSDDVRSGIVTASAGNMGLGAAWFAKRLGVRCTVLVPPTAPESKIKAMEALGAIVVRVTHDQWWTAFVERRADGIDGVFIHAFDDPRVMAGNGTIAMEILEDLPATTAILAPWGGGGLSCGIATAARAIAPAVHVYASEVATAAPFSAALAAGEPVSVEMTESFVDGIGSRTVLRSMYDRAVELGIRSLVAPVDDVADALVTLLEHNHVLAEGAGATPIACALQAGAFTAADTVVCVVSGGMIDRSTVIELLSQRTT